ncbi:MAG TPA: riboflavin biosynthesis protein RibF, partial [Chloroflexi bacterium]|nr:riboflavin biosynthesis protein RibF [Chloroflexota bacterium]
MRTVHDLSEARISARSHLTVGVFDGIHLGHQKLINRLVETAHADEHVAVVLTFTPHPA